MAMNEFGILRRPYIRWKDQVRIDVGRRNRI